MLVAKWNTLTMTALCPLFGGTSNPHVFPDVQTVTLILRPQFCCQLWQRPGPLSCIQGELKGLHWPHLYDKWL